MLKERVETYKNSTKKDKFIGIQKAEDNTFRGTSLINFNEDIDNINNS